MARQKKQPASLEPKVRLPIMVDIDLLEEFPGNSQKQSKHVFNELKASIEENGFDESIIVVPNEQGKYYIVSGNHRARAARELGYLKLPAVVREDWDSVSSQIQVIRRNYVRGAMDKAAFTAAVNKLSNEAELSIDDIVESLGFEDSEAFAEYYKEERQREQHIAEDATAVQNVKFIDDLGLALSALFAQYGETVANGFIIFPYGNANHMFVPTTPSIKKVFEQVAQGCVEQGITMQVALAGLLVSGIHATGFGRTNKNTAQVVKDGENAHNGDPKLELLYKRELDE